MGRHLPPPFLWERINIKIIDTLAGMPHKFCRTTWEQYIHSIDSNLLVLLEEDAKVYDFEAQILPVIQACLSQPDKMQQAHQSFIAATNALAGKVDFDVDVILYLGLCNGAGWVTQLGGRWVLLLGIEKIVELNWICLDKMRSLIYHELGHVWYYTQGSPMPRGTWFAQWRLGKF